MASKLTRLLIALLICSVVQACSDNEANVHKLKEIEQLWTTVPIYPGMVEVSYSSPSEGEMTIDRNYKSDAPFNEVRRFYTEKLTHAGWQVVGDTEVKDRGRFRGERLVEFRKGEYELDLQYAGQRKADFGWDYSIDITWARR